MAIYAVIMAGGSGTRLWPLSRQQRPKQALPLIGRRTLFQEAIDRIRPLIPPERILTVTRREHAALLRDQAPELPLENFVIEPEGRGTAPAIGLAAIQLQRIDPQATMVVLTADHHIAAVDDFRHALCAAAQVASEGYLVTLGIRPASPSTGYGYIQHGPRLDTADLPAFQVERFVEKPGLEQARAMVDSGEYSWNSGMFVWRVDRILQEFGRHMPELYRQLREVGAALKTASSEATLSRVWPRVTKQTIDYGVMEQADRVAVIPVDIGWTDVGSWGSLWSLLTADQNGNIAVGPHVGIDTQDTLTFGSRRLIATIGVRDMVIVDTDDAVLVCPRAHEQAVRDLVDQLKREDLQAWL
jgi:mannose-1-phosphate guanylyltransferase